LKPVPGVIVICVVPLAPGAIVKLAGEADNENDAGDATVTLKLNALVKLPLVPVIVIGYVPSTAAFVAETVITLVPDPGDEIVDGENDTETPVGNAPPPLDAAVNAIAPANPLAIVLVIVSPAFEPCCAVTPEKFDVNVNAGTTLILIFAIEVSPPPVAVTEISAGPNAAFAAAEIVSVVEPLPGPEKLLDPSVAVTPDGAPLTESVTALL
jgi:hypothetical protein